MAKFCTRCGRRLEDGKACSCTSATISSSSSQEGSVPDNQQMKGEQTQYNYHSQKGQNQYYQERSNQNTKEAEWFNGKKDAFVSGTKNMFAQILPILRTPVTTVQNIASSNSTAVGMEFLIAKSLICLILTLIGLEKLSLATGGYLQIPYLKITLFVLCVTAGIDFLEALLMKVFTRVCNGFTNYSEMITTIGARALYECLILLAAGILCLISVRAAFFVYLLCILILPYIQYSAYQAVARVSDDKKPYIFFVGKLCIAIILFLMIYIMLNDISTSLLTGIDTIMNSIMY